MAGLCCSTQAFSNCDEWATLHFAVQTSPWGGFSRCRAQALGIWASVVVTHGQRGKWTERELASPPRSAHLAPLWCCPWAVRMAQPGTLGQSGRFPLVPSWPSYVCDSSTCICVHCQGRGQWEGSGWWINGSHDPDQDPMRRADGVTSCGWRTCCRDAAAGVPGHIWPEGPHRTCQACVPGSKAPSVHVHSLNWISSLGFLKTVKHT